MLRKIKEIKPKNPQFNLLLQIQYCQLSSSETNVNYGSI